MKNKILLHICCGVCSSSVVERLRQENFEVIGFFYNPNVHPQSEYESRLKVAREVSKILEFSLIEDNYDKDNWFKLTLGLEDEPEGAKRCETCFKMRLEKTHKKSVELGISIFTTTLSVSSHKNTAVINKIGRQVNERDFLEVDFKKKDGAKLAIEFAKKHNLYRQNYCGCEYSNPKYEINA